MRKIEINNLEVKFGETVALKNVSMDIYDNEILSVIGPANSGKTSLIMAINRMIDGIAGASVKGSIKMDGKEITSLKHTEDLRRRVGTVFALPIPLPMSIKDNVLFGPRLIKHVRKSDADHIVESSLKAAFLWEEVKDRLDSSALKLSGGQQQRLCIARTLALEPDVIMFDEPCSGLDPISTAKVEDAMKELKNKHTLILVTNNTKQAARVGERTAFLLMGELVEICETRKMFTTPDDKRTEDYIIGKFG